MSISQQYHKSHQTYHISVISEIEAAMQFVTWSIWEPLNPEALPRGVNRLNNYPSLPDYFQLTSKSLSKQMRKQGWIHTKHASFTIQMFLEGIELHVSRRTSRKKEQSQKGSYKQIPVSQCWPLLFKNIQLSPTTLSNITIS